MIKKTIILSLIWLCCLSIQANTISLEVQTFKADTKEFVSERMDFDPKHTAIIIIDMWNYHWCMTASERVAAMVPRMNAVLSASRSIGMQVVWNPSDVVTSYIGWPQYEKAIAVKHLKAPKTGKDISAHFTAKGGACLCGPGFSCGDNYGWDKMNPDLVIEKEDLISSSTDEIYSLFKDRGITDIIYMGVHTNICVYGKPGGMSEMQKAGFRCFLARDLNDAFTHYNPNENFTPDDGTSQTDKDLQQGGIPCINMGDEFKKKGLLKTTAPFDYVRFVPWGKTDRPFLFEGTTTVTLTAPWLNKAQIHYTTDGSTPTLHSPVYTKPLVINQTERLRAIAFRGKRQISLASDAYYVKMPEYIPPLPDIYLDSLEFITNEYLKVVKDFAWIPVRSKSFNENGLRLRKKSYVHGLGMRTPCGIQFDLKPEYSRFVALAGVDENILGETNGRFVAMHCKVIFKIFVDGELMAESPVMCITQEPWRFDILIPRGSHRISITCMDANGDFYPLNYGDLVNAGFILDK